MPAFLLSGILLSQIKQTLSLWFRKFLWCIQIPPAVAPDTIFMHVQYCHCKMYTVDKDADHDHDDNGDRAQRIIIHTHSSALPFFALKQQ